MRLKESFWHCNFSFRKWKIANLLFNNKSRHNSRSRGIKAVAIEAKAFSIHGKFKIVFASTSLTSYESPLLLGLEAIRERKFWSTFPFANFNCRLKPLSSFNRHRDNKGELQSEILWLHSLITFSYKLLHFLITLLPGFYSWLNKLAVYIVDKREKAPSQHQPKSTHSTLSKINSFSSFVLLKDCVNFNAHTVAAFKWVRRCPPTNVLC